jgi:hypothetical protein
MKIIGFIFAIILISLNPIKAQGENKIGVSAALTQIRFHTNTFPELYNNRSGFSVAIKIQLLSSDFFSLVPQLEYTQKGFVEIIPVFAGEDFKADTRFDYMSIPIFIRLHYTRYNIIPYFKIGPRLDVLINKELGEFKIGQQVLPTTFGKKFADIILGGSFAAGIEFRYLPLDLFVEFRYNWDETDSLPNKTSINAKFSSYDIWFGTLFSL